MPPRVHSSGYVFEPPLTGGVIVYRPNRFVMVVNSSGRTWRCHCPTTGRLGDLDLRGMPCLLSKARNKARKTAFTVEAISPGGGKAANRTWVGINQNAANRYIEHLLRTRQLTKMADGEVRREVKLGHSRIDFSVGGTYVEVKTPLITLPSGPKVRRVRMSRFNSFDRLIKHMRELSRSLGGGKRTIIAMCYLYDAKRFRPPARDKYNGKILDAAERADRSGVETWQVNLAIDKNGVSLTRYFRNHLFERESHK